jgi:hypothetical protein
MSVICTVAGAGACYLGPAALSGIATATAAVMAMRQLKAAEGEVQLEEERLRLEDEARAMVDAVSQVELNTEQRDKVGSLVAERCHLVFTDDRLEITLTRDVRGKLTVRAHGEGMTRAEVSEAAERFLGLVMQQVAYREVVTKMKRYGLDVQQEARLEDGTVKLRIGTKGR